MIEIIGRQYQEYDKQGQASGCMMPIYYIHPQLKAFAYDYPDDRAKLGEYMRTLFEKHLQSVRIEDVKEKDILLIDYGRGFVHPAVYLKNGEMVHCMKNTGVEICKMPPPHRIKGVYRCP